MEYPEGIRVTKDREVIVSERGNNRLSLFTHDGNFIRHIGDGVPDGLLEPVGVASDNQNRVYVCDTGAAFR